MNDNTGFLERERTYAPMERQLWTAVYEAGHGVHCAAVAAADLSVRGFRKAFPYTTVKLWVYNPRHP